MSAENNDEYERCDSCNEISENGELTDGECDECRDESEELVKE